MAYTINALAKFSKVSVRTLRFYDEIGLLKPAYYGHNKYRYYEEEQLLRLQQILFFRELKLSLSQVQKVMSSTDFDKIETLNAHKQILERSLRHTEALVKTINKTILHLKGQVKMKDTEIFEGFEPKKQKKYKNYLTDKKMTTLRETEVIWKKIKHWTKEDWQEIKQAGEEIHRALAVAVEKPLHPASPEVQSLIHKHHTWVKRFLAPIKDSHIELERLYLEHPHFKEFFQCYHPGLAAYLAKAMKIFLEKKLVHAEY